MTVKEVSQKYTLEQLIDVNLFQPFLIQIYKITGIVPCIFDVNGKILPSLESVDSVCTRFHLVFPQSRHECAHNDRSMFEEAGNRKKQIVRQCRNGLIDGISPIFVEDIYLGAIVFGQIIVGEPDLDFFARQAEKYGFDQKEYLEAIAITPKISREQYNWILSFIDTLTEMISKLVRAKISEIEEKEYLESQIAERTIALAYNEEKYRLLFEFSSEAILLFHTETHAILDSNPAAIALYGYPKRELLNHVKITDLFHTELPDGSVMFETDKILQIPFALNIKKDGAQFPVEYTCGGISIHGKKTGFIIIKDLTEIIQNNVKQNQIIKRIQAIFEEVKNFSEFVTIDADSLKPKKYLKNYGITPQEDKIIYYIKQGLSNKEIAETLVISVDTVKKHISAILKKLNLKNRFELVQNMKENNIVTTYLPK